MKWNALLLMQTRGSLRLIDEKYLRINASVCAIIELSTEIGVVIH